MMTNLDLRNWAQSLQERNPLIDYTSILELIENTPVLSPSQNTLLIYGQRGNGVPMYAYWFGMSLIPQGWNLSIINSYDSLPPIIANQLEVCATMTPPEDYLRTVDTLRLGTADSPHAVVLYDMGDDISDHLRAMIADPWTCVIIAYNEKSIPQELADLMPDRLWIGTNADLTNFANFIGLEHVKLLDDDPYRQSIFVKGGKARKLYPLIDYGFFSAWSGKLP